MLRTIRQSFRRKKQPRVPESNRPHQWQKDEEAVKEAKCSFHVKYLGSVEVQESRGMHVCEQAVKQLKSDLRKKRVPHFFGRHKKKKIQAVLYVSPDSLRVVENSTKALLLDQTIEKVSFCAPDRNYDRAFSYICRDGTTKRWLCHSFFAVKESGERLSHAVGCAFAACLEKKQKREKETGVTVTYDKNRTTFTREGSFRVQTLTEQQEKANAAKTADPAQVHAQVHNPSAVPRPHAPLHLIRQASMRPFGTKKGEDPELNTPFKRNYSVQVNKLPSTINRQNIQVMNPVPELDEPFDANNSQSQTTNMFTHKDDPFAKAPMPKLGSVSTPKPANGYNEILKPTSLPVNNQQSAALALQQAGFTGASSPVRDTNPWAADARQQQPAMGDPGSAVMTRHQRTPSEADRWLNSVQQQTGAMPTSTNTGFSSMTPQNLPFNWSKNNGQGFQVNL